MLEGDRICKNCAHRQSDHRWSTDGFCQVTKCECGTLDVSEGDIPPSLDGDLARTIANLEKHFGRLPTDREVYRFVFGTKEERERIYQEKGMPRGWS